mmetsp:Transcript_16087/g.50578  ORF Transcript_16087/g.50578 Transcript_16087/m.50578 type:complete len:209 (-) Transcript_16087:756-1382(-)
MTLKWPVHASHFPAVCPGPGHSPHFIRMLAARCSLYCTLLSPSISSSTATPSPTSLLICGAHSAVLRHEGFASGSPSPTSLARGTAALSRRRAAKVDSLATGSSAPSPRPSPATAAALRSFSRSDLTMRTTWLIWSSAEAFSSCEITCCSLISLATRDLRSTWMSRWREVPSSHGSASRPCATTCLKTCLMVRRCGYGTPWRMPRGMR